MNKIFGYPNPHEAHLKQGPEDGITMLAAGYGNICGLSFEMGRVGLATYFLVVLFAAIPRGDQEGNTRYLTGLIEEINKVLINDEASTAGAFKLFNLEVFPHRICSSLCASLLASLQPALIELYGNEEPRAAISSFQSQRKGF